MQFDPYQPDPRLFIPSDEPDREEDPADRVGTFDEEGALIPLLLKADYLFDGRANSTQTVILADGVDTTRMRVGAVTLVVHQRNSLTASANFDVRAHNVSLSPEQPDVTFVDASRMVGLSTIIFGTIPTAGLRFVEVIPLVQPVGPQLRVSLVFRQGATTSLVVQTLTLSLYLISRTRE